MPDHGKDLGADLYELWLAGTDNLPSVAAEYGRAASDVTATDSAYAVMWRPSRFGGDNYGPVYYSWTALRDELQSILGDTAGNLTLTGEALVLAANQYAKTDSAAAAEMKRLIQVDGTVQP
jgi:hypothetical protein